MTASRKKPPRRRPIDTLLDQLKQGVTPEKLALTVALGAVLGVFPVIGSTTLLCLLVGYRLKLNQPVLQLINYAVYPLQFACLIPLYRAGADLFGEPPPPLTPWLIKTWVQSDPLGAFQELWTTSWHAAVAWCFFAPPAAALLYALALPLFRRLKIPKT